MSQLVLHAPGAFGFRDVGTAHSGATGEDILNRQRLLQFRFPARERLAQETSDLLDEEVVASWFGTADAKPAFFESVAAALRFLSLLAPSYLVGLEVAPDHDGTVSFDWHEGIDRQLSLSFGPQGELHYAAILGPVERANGRLLFDDSIPDEIARLIARVNQP